MDEDSAFFGFATAPNLAGVQGVSGGSSPFSEIGSKRILRQALLRLGRLALNIAEASASQLGFFLEFVFSLLTC